MRLYEDLASWWPLMSAPADYAEEAEFYIDTLRRGCAAPPRDVLELGSGGGNNALYMKREFQMTLVDPASGMLAVSERLNPECTHLVGDMRTLRLGQQFDAVFVHDAVCYMTTEADLGRAIETAFVHCRPGGAALFCPDYLKETFAEITEEGGEDGEDRAMRWFGWVHDADPQDSLYTVDYVYLLRDREHHVQVEHDRHVEGVFTRETWLRLLREAGFEPEMVGFDHSELEPESYFVFLARRAA